MARALRVRAIGFDQDGQTIDRQWFTATTPPVLALDEDDGYRYGYGIKVAREAAERVGQDLRKALRRAWAAIDPGPARGRARGMTRYWAGAEELFWPMVRGQRLRLPGQPRSSGSRSRAFEDTTSPHDARPPGDPSHGESSRRDLRVVGPHRTEHLGRLQVPDDDLILKNAEELVREVRKLTRPIPADRSALRHSLGHAPEDAALAVHRIVTPHLPGEHLDDATERAFYAVPAYIAAQPREARDEDGCRDGTDRPRYRPPEPGRFPGPRAFRQGPEREEHEPRLQLLARQDLEGLHRQLPRLILYLRGNQVRIDWAVLIRDLARWGRRPGAGRQGMDAVLLPHQRTADRGEETRRCSRRHDRKEREEMSTPLYVDIHALQTVPYANLNRDDLGSPKTLIYGGTERTRVSSQSWKRVVRHEIERRLGDPALRTRRVVQAVSALLIAQGWDPDLAAAGARQVDLVRGQERDQVRGPPEGQADQNITSVTLYLPASGIEELAAIVAEHRDAVAAEAAKKKPKPVLPQDRVAAVLRSRNGTIQLLGRMLAELPGAEVDGAVQFAHAFTTHGTVVETDFFTAVDDIEKEGDAGSAHMNAAQFSAGTFYRYANIGLGTLLANLDGDVATARELTGRVPPRVRHDRAVRQAERHRRDDHPGPGLHRRAVGPARVVRARVREPVGSELGYGAPSRDALCELRAHAERVLGHRRPGPARPRVHLGQAHHRPRRAGRLPRRAARRLRRRGVPRRRPAMTGMVLRLAGPLQSWGEHSTFADRDTLRYPTRSGITGIFAAAQGLRRGEPLDRYAPLTFTVRVDRPGVHLADFHTTGGGLPRERTVPTADGGRRAEGKATIVTRRMYLSDAVFTVAVEGPAS